MRDKPSLLDRWPDTGVCPYCLSKTGEARTCSACGRDVDLLREFHREIRSLKAEQVQGGRPPRIDTASLARRSFSRYGWAIVALLVADVAIQFIFDAHQFYLLVAAFVIPVVFGYSLGIRIHGTGDVARAMFAAAVAAVIAVALMGMLMGLLGQGAPYPVGKHEWKEALQFVTTIAFAFATGVCLAQAVRWGVLEPDEMPSEWLREWFLPQHFDDLPFDAQARKLKRMYAFVASAVSGAISVLGMLHGRLPH